MGRFARRLGTTRLCLEPLEPRAVPSFLAPVKYTLPGTGDDVAVGDFNNDGKPDVAATYVSGTQNTLAVYLGDGAGGLTFFGYYAVGNGEGMLAVADFNGDARLDLAVTNVDTVSVLLGRGDGTFQPPHQFQSGPPTTVAVATGDINGDGRPDLALANLGDGDTKPDTVSTIRGNGDGTFQAPTVYSVGTGGATGVAVGDLDGDGLADVTVDAYWVSCLYVFGGNGTFTGYNVNVPIGNTQADLNGDGRLDVVTGGFGYSLGVLLNRGDGTLLAPKYYVGSSTSWNPKVADLNKDGKPDIVVSSKSQSVSWLLGNGDGSFQAPGSHAVPGSDVHVALVDLKKDGYTDIVVVTNTGFAVLLNDGRWPQKHTLLQHPPAPGGGPGITSVQPTTARPRRVETPVAGPVSEGDERRGTALSRALSNHRLVGARAAPNGGFGGLFGDLSDPFAPARFERPSGIPPGAGLSPRS
jgi:hypothetical protein